MPETTKGREHAVAKLWERRKANADKPQKANGALPAGSPMYYYCISCGEEIEMPEEHLGAPPSLCEECKALKELGWLTE